jgi:hypothetical protein
MNASATWELPESQGGLTAPAKLSAYSQLVPT